MDVSKQMENECRQRSEEDTESDPVWEMKLKELYENWKQLSYKAVVSSDQYLEQGGMQCINIQGVRVLIQYCVQ